MPYINEYATEQLRQKCVNLAMYDVDPDKKFNRRRSSRPFRIISRDIDKRIEQIRMDVLLTSIAISKNGGQKSC